MMAKTRHNCRICENPKLVGKTPGAHRARARDIYTNFADYWLSQTTETASCCFNWHRKWPVASISGTRKWHQLNTSRRTKKHMSGNPTNQELRRIQCSVFFPESCEFPVPFDPPI